MKVQFKSPDLTSAEAPALLEKAATHFRDVVQHLPHFSMASKTDDLGALQAHADHFRKFKDVVVLGTGGSSLGAKTLCALQDFDSPSLHFMDNVDPHSFEKLFARLDPLKTGVLVVSKSGGTAETLAQFLTCLHHWPNPKEHFILITEPTDNKLRELGQKYGLPTLDHPTDIGGRFSCLTLVGLLPAMIAELDARKIREGAEKYLEDCLSNPKAAPVVGAVQAALCEKTHPTHVVMPYVDRLTDFGMWYRQLWAESLGKEGRGLTPIRAMGTVDQHSQLQLYLGGPKDKLFTVIYQATQGHGDVLKDTGVSYLENKTLGDLLHAEARATTETLKSNGCHVRTLELDQIDEATLGALFMHYMIETVLTAHLMGVDAFDQPAVEECKILTKEYMSA